MGMFDRVVVNGFPLTCHNGHDITGQHNLDKATSFVLRAQ